MPNARELYVVDLQERTFERVTQSSANGGDTDGAVLDGATISADGNRVAFVSFAGNLFRGDANQRPDAFVATRQPDPSKGWGRRRAPRIRVPTARSKWTARGP